MESHRDLPAAGAHHTQALGHWTRRKQEDARRSLGSVHITQPCAEWWRGRHGEIGLLLRGALSIQRRRRSEAGSASRHHVSATLAVTGRSGDHSGSTHTHKIPRRRGVVGIAVAVRSFNPRGIWGVLELLHREGQQGLSSMSLRRTLAHAKARLFVA